MYSGVVHGSVLSPHADAEERDILLKDFVKHSCFKVWQLNHDDNM